MRKLGLLTLALVILIAAVGTVSADSNRNFVAHLSGDNEVPANATPAQGQAIFHLSKDGDALEFKLIVANIDNITQAHIHCGPPGVNGPVVVFLYGLGPTVTLNGILSQGVATNADVIPRPSSAACPGGVATLDDVIAKMRSGQAYANVHTTALPGGEIRGQIR
jgi:hypothetical protein